MEQLKATSCLKLEVAKGEEDLFAFYAIVAAHDADGNDVKIRQYTGRFKRSQLESMREDVEAKIKLIENHK